MTLVDQYHQPTPPSEIVQRLKQIHPSLGLRWASGCFWSEERGRFADSWAITEEWGEGDSRRRMVRDGLMPLDECHDVLCYLPEDCTADQAYGYFVTTLKRGSGKEGVRRLLERVHEFNKRAREEAIRPTMELAEELITANKYRVRSDAVSKHKRENKAKQQRDLREYLDQ